MDTKKQVEASHYNFDEYVTWERWQSYYTQLSTVLRSQPKSVLVVGAGDGLVASMLKTLGIDVKTVDIDPDLKPDYCLSILEMSKSIPAQFDLVLCCQVLEHLPFENFRACLKELKALSKERVILSLPYRSFRPWNMVVKLPRLKPWFFAISIPIWFKKIKFDGEHYWEVGAKGFSNRFIKNILSEAFKVNFSFKVEGNPYHIFYNCQLDEEKDS